MTGGPTPGVPPAGIRHVLFDADGVIQSVPGGWYTAIEPYLGERATTSSSRCSPVTASSPTRGDLSGKGRFCYVYLTSAWAGSPRAARPG